jgi:hypothetical protein
VLDPARWPGGDHDRAEAPVRRAGSRVVDTVPVTDRGWDRAEDAAVVVPSRVGHRGEVTDGSGGRGSTPQPRLAEVEEVAGRPVHVVYRPSRGLEVAEPSQPRRVPLHDGPRFTDTVVR